MRPSDQPSPVDVKMCIRDTWARFVVRSLAGFSIGPPASRLGHPPPGSGHRDQRRLVELSPRPVLRGTRATRQTSWTRWLTTATVQTGRWWWWHLPSYWTSRNLTCWKIWKIEWNVNTQLGMTVTCKHCIVVAKLEHWNTGTEKLNGNSTNFWSGRFINRAVHNWLSGWIATGILKSTGAYNPNCYWKSEN